MKEEANENTISINLYDTFFKSQAYKYIFALLYTDTKLRKELLEITEELYEDEKKAKEWRNKIILVIHPDNCQISGTIDANKKLNELYDRMVSRDE